MNGIINIKQTNRRVGEMKKILIMLGSRGAAWMIQ